MNVFPVTVTPHLYYYLLFMDAENLFKADTFHMQRVRVFALMRHTIPRRQQIEWYGRPHYNGHWIGCRAAWCRRRSSHTHVKKNRRLSRVDRGSAGTLVKGCLRVPEVSRCI